MSINTNLNLRHWTLHNAGANLRDADLDDKSNSEIKGVLTGAL